MLPTQLKCKSLICKMIKKLIFRLVSKSTKNNFVFTTNGYLKMGKNQATCTFFLDKNSRKTFEEIAQRDQGNF